MNDIFYGRDTEAQHTMLFVCMPIKLSQAEFDCIWYIVHIYAIYVSGYTVFVVVAKHFISPAFVLFISRAVLISKLKLDFVGLASSSPNVCVHVRFVSIVHTVDRSLVLHAYQWIYFIRLFFFIVHAY